MDTLPIITFLYEQMLSTLAAQKRIDLLAVKGYLEGR